MIKKTEIHTAEDAPEKSGVQLLAKIHYGDCAVCAVGHYAIIRHQDKIGETVSTTEAFIVDAGGMIVRWCDVIQWMPYSDIAPDGFDYNPLIFDKKHHRTIARIAEKWADDQYQLGIAKGIKNNA